LVERRAIGFAARSWVLSGPVRMSHPCEAFSRRTRLKTRFTKIGGLSFGFARYPAVDSFADLAPRSRNHPTRALALLRFAASSGESLSYPTQFKSAPRSRRYSAVAL